MSQWRRSSQVSIDVDKDEASCGDEAQWGAVYSQSVDLERLARVCESLSEVSS